MIIEHLKGKGGGKKEHMKGRRKEGRKEGSGEGAHDRISRKDIKKGNTSRKERKGRKKERTDIKEGRKNIKEGRTDGEKAGRNLVHKVVHQVFHAGSAFHHAVFHKVVPVVP